MLFKHTKVIKATDLSERQLIYISERGIVGVAVEAQGRGSSRQYSKFNVFQAVLFRTLRECGLEFASIKNYMERDVKRIWELMRGDETEHLIYDDNGVDIKIDLVELRRAYDRAMGRLE